MKFDVLGVLCMGFWLLDLKSTGTVFRARYVIRVSLQNPEDAPTLSQFWPTHQTRKEKLLKQKYEQVFDRSGDTSYLSLLEVISSVEEQHFWYDDVTKDSWHAQTLLARCSRKLAALDTRRELGRVNFRKDFWDFYWGQEKITNSRPLADPYVLNSHPRRLSELPSR